MLLSSGERVTSALLSIALNELGYKAEFFSGRKGRALSQIAFLLRLRIKHIDTSAIKAALKRGENRHHRWFSRS